MAYPLPPSIQTNSDHLQFAMVRILTIYETSFTYIKQSDSKQLRTVAQHG
jgi:hypothetical protein